MEGGWSQAISNPEILNLFGWSDPNHIIGLATLVSKPVDARPHDILSAVHVLDAHSIPLEQRTTLLKRVTTDPVSGALIISPSTASLATTPFGAATPLRASSRIVSWTSAPTALASINNYQWHPSIKAFWSNHTGQLFFPEYTGSSATPSSVAELVPPTTSKSFKDDLRVLLDYGGDNAAQPDAFGVLKDVQIPVPPTVRDLRAPYRFSATSVNSVKSDTNKGRVYAVEQLLPRLSSIFDATLYATNEGLREATEIAEELQILFELIKTAPTLGQLHEFLEDVFEDEWRRPHPPAHPDDVSFSRLIDASKGASHSAHAEFKGQQSVISLRVLSQVLRGEIRHQYESAYALVHPDRPTFDTDETRHEVIPLVRLSHAATAIKATRALDAGLKSTTSPDSRRGGHRRFGGSPRKPGYSRGGRGNHRSSYTRTPRHTGGYHPKVEDTPSDSGGGEAATPRNTSDHGRGGGRGRGYTPRGRGRGGR
jgi:hypothetical protein